MKLCCPVCNSQLFDNSEYVDWNISYACKACLNARSNPLIWLMCIYTHDYTEWNIWQLTDNEQCGKWITINPYKFLIDLPSLGMVI